MPAGEVDVTVALVGELLRRQFPDLAGEPLALLANGWDNVLVRVGADLVARLPRRHVAVGLIESEQRWLPELAPALPLPVPEPVRVGGPDGELGYPWPWSLCRYLPGRSVLSLLDEGGRFADPAREARRLAELHRALHRTAPADAPVNPYRGIPLADRDDRLQLQLDDVGDAVDHTGLRDVWADSLDAPVWDGPPVWLHGDPHPGNLLTDGAQLTGVIDFGDMCGGDPATDLAAGWMVFDADARPAYREAVAADDATWRRARGWALGMGMAMLVTSEDNPPYRRLGERTLAAVLADPP